MIKVIIFDWGGVLTKGRHTDSIIRLLEKKFNTSIKNHRPSFVSFMDMIDFKDIGFEDFVDRVNREFQLGITTEEMRAIFSQAIIPNKEVLNLVRGLRKEYRVVALSNNSKVTVHLLKTSHESTLDLFEKAYISFEVGKHKPNRDFFEYVLDDLNLEAGQCVFIDDNQKNVEVAGKIGINSILYKNAKQLEKDLKNCLKI